ncbi:lysozyme [Novosphingobium beihaiensis]|uniref:Lysozyme n=1 Tax=Novosphingobium beihaiensis TaxID=2930389 RepID=A0ABT0BPP7_9SPHN|nr:lysozyme [Novosphingobium beihaiensis]MCJ2186953.1 lysozyme [Novosphingobium beihaiensis]
MLDRKPIFDEVRRMLGRGFDDSEVARLDSAIDHAVGATPLTAQPEHRLGPAGKALIRKWEGCGKCRADGRFDAYPDPGSTDGAPWTIGWGSTGPDIAKGTVWTQAECDARFDRDIQRYADAVSRALGDAPATQNQFDALVSFHYNTGAIAKATLTKLHCQGRYAEAQKEFGKWIYNDGKPMPGLRDRRAEEAELYGRE